MDFIQEALERQMELWNALLTGSVRQRPEEAEDEERARRSGPGEAAEEAGTAASQGSREQSLSSRSQAPESPAGQAESQEKMAEGDQQAQEGKSWDQGPYPMALSRAAGSSQEAESGGAQMIWRTESGTAAGTADVLSLALTLERDARRFDGGYTLY